MPVDGLAERRSLARRRPLMADRTVEVTVRPEVKMAAVVGGVVVQLDQDGRFRTGQGPVRVLGIHLITRQLIVKTANGRRRAGKQRAEREKGPVGGKAGMK